MHIFISHSSKEAETAEGICRILEEHGKKCFLAPRDIRGGREYAEEIIDGIDQSEAMLLLMSEAANRSPHVLREVERAVSKGIPILVYKLEEVELSKSMEYFLMTHQWVQADVSADYREILKCFTKQENFGKNSKEKRAKEKSKRPIGVILLVVFLLAGVAAWGITQFAGQAGLFQSKEPKLQVGDTVTLGTYNDEAIRWRVLRLSADGKEAVLISEKILTMKAYDAAESGIYNSDGINDYWYAGTEADTDLDLQVLVRGNNDWGASNIRTWLNSSEEVVRYQDQSPASTAMSELHNGYQNEPGFLYGFTEEELSVIVESQIITKGNALAEGENFTTMDKVYLLSKEELQWFEDAGISMLATPTKAAIEQDDSGWYQLFSQDYDVEEYMWWLRTPVEGTSSQCYLVGNGYSEKDFYEKNVGLEGFGIRPAITVDAQAVIFENKE